MRCRACTADDAAASRGASWLAPALGLTDPARVVEQYAVWGGVPRYWELAADYPTLREAVAREVDARFPHHLGSVWEDLARAAVPRLAPGGRAWGPAARWWGAGADGPLQLDLVATDGDHALVGEVKTTLRAGEIDRMLADLEARAARCPDLRGKRITATLWAIEAPRHERVIDAAAVIGPLPPIAGRS